MRQDAGVVRLWLMILCSACTAAPADGVVCRADGDCPPGRSCRAGLCQVVCEGDACVCTSDAQCSAGQLCDRASGQCLVPECTGDRECATDRGYRPGLLCDRGACTVDPDLDEDGDSVPDGTDNCWMVVNTGQDDLDGDGVGDECDLDRDGDGLDDQVDNCPGHPNDEQTDRNRNGVGDACEDDRVTLVVTVDVQPDWIPSDQRFVQVRVVGPGFRDTNERVGDSAQPEGSAPRPATFGPIPSGRYIVLVERPGFSAGGAIEVDVEAGDDEKAVSVIARLDDLGAADVRMSGVTVSAPDGLQGVTLRNADLSGATLDGVDLSGRDLGGARFATASLKRANLDCATLTNASFFGAEMGDASLRRVTAPMARFDSASLRRTVWDDVDADPDCAVPDSAFAGASFAYSDLEEASLRGVRLAVDTGRAPEFSFARLRRVDMSGADLAGVGFLVADLTEAQLDGANLSGARLTSALMTDVSARGSRLDGATLTGAVLRHTDLRCADRTCASLRGADLTAVSLVGAQLDGADLSNITALGLTTGHSTTPPEELPTLCDLPDGCTWEARSACELPLPEECRIRRTSFNEVNFTDALLNGVVFDRVLLGLARFDRARLQGAAFSQSRLDFASFPMAEMAGARFPGQTVQFADFSGADLTGADFTGAQLGSTAFSNCPWSGPAYDCRQIDFRNGEEPLCEGESPNPTGYCTAADAQSCLGVCQPAQLRGAVFTAATLTGVNLRGTDLTTASFRLANLEDARLQGAELANTDMSGANLHCASLEAATILGADLSRSNLTATDFDGSSVTDTSFADAYGGTGFFRYPDGIGGVPGPWFRGATLNNTDWNGSTMDGLRLDDAVLEGTATTGSVWSYAVLDRAVWSRGDLRGEMVNVCFRDAELLNTSFSRGAFMRNLIFPGALFTNVNLVEVRFNEGTSFEGADMTCACAYDASYFAEGLVCPDGSENLEGETCGLRSPPDCD